MICELNESELGEMYEKLTRWCIAKVPNWEKWEEELQTEARVGFVKAIRSWRADGGAKFITLATICINKHIWRKVKTLKNRPKYCKPLEWEEVNEDWENTQRETRDALRAEDLIEELAESHKLLTRERKLLRELAKGKLYKQVAKEWEVSSTNIALMVSVIRAKVKGVKFKRPLSESSKERMRRRLREIRSNQSHNSAEESVG